MKINVGNQVYLVHFNTYQLSFHREDSGSNLTGTRCFLRKLEGTEKVLVNVGEVRQNVKDKSNLVFARKQAFSKAINSFSKAEREIFWENYKETTRYK